MSKPTLRALVLVAVFVLSEVLAYWFYGLWYTLRYDPNEDSTLWQVLATIKGIIVFALMPTSMVALAYQHMDKLVPPGD